MNIMQTPDTKPGAYFVTCIDGARVGRLAGPFINDHAAALALVDRARAEAERIDPRAAWYAFGTCRVDLDHPQATRPGVLNAALGLSA